MFRAAKDLIASNAARLYLDKLVEPYGKLQELKIDSRARTAHIVCLPHGEPSAITIEVNPYVVIKEEGKSYLEIRACTCSRPWLNQLLNDLARGRRFELPPLAAAAL